MPVTHRFFHMRNRHLLEAVSDAAFAGRNFVMVDIPSGSHPDASGQSLEDAFNLVVLVGAARLDIQVHGCGVA